MLPRTSVTEGGNPVVASALCLATAVCVQCAAAASLLRTLLVAGSVVGRVEFLAPGSFCARLQIKPGKIVIILAGRYAGKKAIVVKNFDEGTKGEKTMRNSSIEFAGWCALLPLAVLRAVGLRWMRA